MGNLRTNVMALLLQIYRSIVLKKFFSRGWGSPENLKRLFEFRKIISQRDICLQLVDVNHPITVDKIVSINCL